MSNSPFDRTQASGDQYATLGKNTGDIGKSQHLIPGFEIISELGRGAFGVVYLARDDQLDRKVAIKVPLFDDPGSREQYVKEAQHAAKLDIDGVVPVYQVGALPSGQPFVVQKFIEGNTLRKEVSESGRLPLHRACSLMAEIASVVARAHEKELIHRDLKPDNILIDESGRPWVADFGLAILEKDQSNHRGERAGTPVYMAPEQFQGRAEWLDGRADIYSMGVMLYELLVGRTPFEAKTLPELEDQVLHRDPKPISQRAPHLPAGLDTIFQNCCAKKVNDRYANAFELVADLEAILPEIPEEVPRGSQRGSQRGALQGSTVVSRKAKFQTGGGTQRNPAAMTLQERRPSKKTYHFLVPVALITAIVSMIIGALWSPLSRRHDPSESKSVDNSNLSQSASLPDPLEKLVRPLRVALSGGTHSTIGAAVAIAEAGETIFIRPGIYNENLAISRSVKLVGEGNRDSIVINGENDAAIEVKNDAQVELQNLTLEGNASSSKQFNTLHVYRGAAELFNCRVVSFSWDCIKAEPGCELKLKKCDFDSKAEPAVYATGAKNLDIAECNFDIRPRTLADRAPVGVQADNSQLQIRASTFHGAPGAIGIHLLNADVPALIENCKFENCEHAIMVQDCTNVSITGDGGATKETKITGCVWGILLQDSSANLAGIEIDGVSTEAGIKIINQGEASAVTPIHISDCTIRGYQHSILASKAALDMQGVLIDSSQLGLSLESMSQATLTNCQFFNSHNRNANTNEGTQSTGIKVDGAKAKLVGCTIEWHYVGVETLGKSDMTFVDCQFLGNFIALMAAADDTHVEGGVFNSNDFGAITFSPAISPQATEQQKRTLTGSPARLRFDHAAFRDSKQASFKFLLPCTLELTECKFQGAMDNAVPILSEELRMLPKGPTTVIEWKNP